MDRPHGQAGSPIPPAHPRRSAGSCHQRRHRRSFLNPDDSTSWSVIAPCPAGGAKNPNFRTGARHAAGQRCSASAHRPGRRSIFPSPGRPRYQLASRVGHIAIPPTARAASGADRPFPGSDLGRFCHELTGNEAKRPALLSAVSPGGEMGGCVGPPQNGREQRCKMPLI